MAPGSRRPNDDYLDSSDSSSSSDEDEVFDVEADDAASVTSLTEIDDHESRDGYDFDDDCGDIDIEDQAQLFDGNLHSREYYLKGLQEFNEAAYDGQGYSPGSVVLLDGIEELWNRYVTQMIAFPLLGSR